MNDHFSTDHGMKLERILPKFDLEEYAKMPCYKLAYHLADLNCVNFSEKQNEIIVSNEVFFMEFWSHCELKMLAKLEDVDTKLNLEESVLIQYDFSGFLKKYCLLIFLPSQTVFNFKLELFAKQFKSSEYSTIPHVHDFFIKKQIAKENKDHDKYSFLSLPKYSLKFVNEKNLDLKLISSHHSSQLIIFETDSVELIFQSSLLTIDILSTLHDIENMSKKLRNLAVVQKNFKTGQIMVKCTVPSIHKRYKLNLFGKDLLDKPKLDYDLVASFYLVRTKAKGVNENLNFINLYHVVESEFFIESPLNYELELGKVHKFKIYIKASALKVCLVEANNKQTFLVQNELDKCLWSVEKIFSTCGELIVYASLKDCDTFKALTTYKLKF